MVRGFFVSSGGFFRLRFCPLPGLFLALMFSLSAFVIGPAISNDDPSRDRDRTPVQTPDPDEHEGHHD